MRNRTKHIATLICAAAISALAMLGDGTYNSSSTPIAVSGVSGATAVALLSNSACALINDGTVKCWGYNGQGQLGNNSTVSSLTPVTVDGVTDATALYAGPYRACAVSTSKGLVCWGADPIWRGD